MLTDTKELYIQARAKIDAGTFSAAWLDGHLKGKGGADKYEAESAQLLILDLMAYMLNKKGAEIGQKAWGEKKGG